jgi:hypothetical protein
MQEDFELENERYDPSIREDLEHANWKEILPRVLYYANYQYKRLVWFGVGDTDPEDLVHEAIALAYGRGENGEFRNWNKTYYPDLPAFLKSVIKSIVNHKIKHVIDFKHDCIDVKKGMNGDSAEEDPRIVKSMYAGMKDDSPEANLDGCEAKREFSERVAKLESIATGDEEMGMVILCFKDSISTPREIAEATGYDVKNVNNIIKRIRRKAKDIK